jgi:hypothetical protein
MTGGMCLHEVAEVFERKDASDCFLVEYGQTFLLVGSPCLRNPRYYALGLLAQKEKFALIFVRGSLIGMLIKACPSSVVTCVDFKEAVAFVVLVPNV